MKNHFFVNRHEEPPVFRGTVRGVCSLLWDYLYCLVRGS